MHLPTTALCLFALSLLGACLPHSEPPTIEAAQRTIASVDAQATEAVQAVQDKGAVAGEALESMGDGVTSVLKYTGAKVEGLGNLVLEASENLKPPP